MDTYNLFFTKVTSLHARAEYCAALIVLALLAVVHTDQMNWWLFAALFFYIDLIGTVPGTIADKRSSNGVIHRNYYLLYNVFHSGLVQAAVVGVLCASIGWQWAYLAIPIHLCVDRGIFNNYVKPFAFRFVAEPLPEFEDFQSHLQQATADRGRERLLSGQP